MPCPSMSRKIILDRPNHFGRVPILLDGSSLFWSGSNHFGQVQIFKISQYRSNLNLTKMSWIKQNDLDPTKTI